MKVNLLLYFSLSVSHNLTCFHLFQIKALYKKLLSYPPTSLQVENSFQKSWRFFRFGFLLLLFYKCVCSHKHFVLTDFGKGNCDLIKDQVNVHAVSLITTQRGLQNVDCYEGYRQLKSFSSPRFQLPIFYVDILARRILIITFLDGHVIMASRKRLLSLASLIETIAMYGWNLRFLYFDYLIIFLVLSCKMKSNQCCFCLTPVLQTHMPLESRELQV